MANPTTNYGFVLPTPSDLVTDLPADFEIALQGVDTQMKTNADAATQKATLTTKGDVYAATAASTVTRLAVGANDTVLTADSSTATGLKWATPATGSPYVAGKNKIINGDFGIWQRGTSVAVPANNVQTFQADRFWAQHNGTTNGTVTYARQTFTVGQTDVPNNPLYFARVTNTTLGTSQTQTEFGQSIEDVSTFAGQTATFSFYVKASGTFTISGFAWQNFGSGGSGSVFTSLTFSTSTTTTSWQRVTATLTVPSISGKTVGSGNYISFYVRMASPTAGSTIDFANWQAELASSASAFYTASGSIEGELALCQRYYYRNAKTALSIGYSTNATSVFDNFFHPVEMRTTPTVIQTGGVTFSSNTSATTFTVDANGSSSFYSMLSFLTGASNGLTYLYRPVEWSAEL